MYFDKPGKDNTDQTLKLAAERADELGINEVVVATTTGRTAYKAMEVFAGKRLTAVTYHCGFKEPFQNRMEDDVRKDIEGKGIRVIASSHALSGVERSADCRYFATPGPGHQGSCGSCCYGGRCRDAYRK